MHSYLSRFLVAATLLVSARAVAADALPEGTRPKSDRVVVMISVDGLAAHYLDDPKADMPNMRKLAAEGARASMMKASTPTVTWPNHTTLVTGDNPARHGVVGNNYYDRATGKKVVLISDPVFDKDQIVKVPTIYDAAKSNGLKTAAIRWPATRNARTLDWTTPDVRSAELFTKYSTPSLLAAGQKAGINILDGSVEAKGNNVFDSKDELFTRLFDLILHEDRPNLALLHVIDVDHTEHLFGPQSAEAYAAVKAADDQVGQVWEELKRDYPARATLVVVSDHGFSSIKRTIMPNVVLRKAGLTRRQNGDVHVVSQGGAEFVYIGDETRRDEIMDRVRKEFSGLEGIASIAGPSELKADGVANPKDDPHAPDMILFAKEGYSFGDTAAGSLPFNEKPERKGSHGHDANLPDLHATFLMWGEGVKPGVNLGEITNIDVAPTIAKLLGIEFPNVDGKPLEAGLAN